MTTPIATDPRAHLRRDLQGLRGWGITLVVIGHLFLWPHGVFAALDIFFVISGYLITGILLAQFPKHGPRFFLGFYLGRARRLMPMALVVLAVTVAGTAVVYSGARAHLVAQDAAWAAVFAVNWHFASSGVDYFKPQSDSPLLHYWSLSVEEQFYLGWPLLVFVALLAFRGRRTRAGLGAVLGAVVVGAFGYSLWHSATNPLVAYFSTFDRVWEFGAGGLLALVAVFATRIPWWVRATMSWVGCAGLLTTIFTLDPSVPFPAPWGLLPVLFSSAIVVGGIGYDLPRQWFLDNPVAVYLGAISYSLYLWHLPVNVLLVPFFPADSLVYYAAALTVSLGLAVVSYHLIERPLRQAPWLMLPAERRAVRRQRSNAPELAVRRRMAAWVAIGGLVVGCTAGFAYLQSRGGETAAALDSTAPTGDLAIQQGRLATALDADRFPDFTPGLDTLSRSTWAAQLVDDGYCADVRDHDLSRCSYGASSSTKTAVLIGDSVAASWTPAVRRALVPEGWRVQQLTLEQCGAWKLPSYRKLDGSAYPACAARQTFILSWIKTHQPDLIILADAADQARNAQRSDLGGMPSNPTAFAETALGGTLAQLDQVEGRVVVLQPPPNTTYLVDCVSRFGGPRDCVESPSATWTEQTAGEQAAVRTATTGAGAVDYVATEDWFCVEQRCPAYVGTTPVTVDGTHLTAAFSANLALLMREALVDAG